jgi:hypothetical protein
VTPVTFTLLASEILINALPVELATFTISIQTAIR